MRRFLFPGLFCVSVLGCGPDRAADDPATQAGLRAAQTPPSPARTELDPGLPPGTRQLTVLRATVRQGDQVLASLRDLQVRTTDDHGGQRLDISSLANGEYVVENGRSCWLIRGEKYLGWRTRPPQKLRAITTDSPCLTQQPLVDLLGHFGSELRVDTQVGRMDFELSPTPRPAPNSIPLTWPTRADGTPITPSLAEPRALYLVSHARADRFDGHAVFDATRHLLSGRLDARFSLRKDGQSATLDLEVRVWQTPFDGQLRPPADFETERPRPRVVPNIKAVLGSLPATPGTLPGPGDAPPLRLPGEQK